MFQGGLLVGALALSISSLVVGNVAALVAPTPAYAASKKSSKKSKGGSVKGVKAKKKVDSYTWAELAKISDAMTRSGSRKAALKIAKEYKLCDKKGKLDGTQTKRMALHDCESTVTIVGLYHDDLADGSGKAGLTWQFTDGLYEGSPLYAFYVEYFDISPSSVKDRLATIPRRRSISMAPRPARQSHKMSSCGHLRRPSAWAMPRTCLASIATPSGWSSPSMPKAHSTTITRI